MTRFACTERLKPSLPVSLNKGQVFFCADVKCQLETKEAYLRWQRGEAESTSVVKACEEGAGELKAERLCELANQQVSRDSDCESMTQEFPNAVRSVEKSYKTPAATLSTVTTRKTGVTTATTVDYVVNTEEPTQRMCGMISNEVDTLTKQEDSSSRSSDMMFGAYDEELEKEPVRRIDFEIATKPEELPGAEEDDRSTVVEDPIELANEQATQIAQLETVEEDRPVEENAHIQSSRNDNGRWYTCAPICLRTIFYSVCFCHENAQN